MHNNKTVLYIGGFQLPDKNAAAQRVLGIAKGIRNEGLDVRFINSLKVCTDSAQNKEYFGFSVFEYKRENNIDYLIGARTAISLIKKEKPIAVIAYNYPAIALNRIRKYCKKNNIKCMADVTEWPEAGGGVMHRIIKRMDTAFRMKYVHKRVDSIIAISRFLLDYYKPYVPVVLIPPTVDITDEKWMTKSKKTTGQKSFVYAGSPSALKERLDIIVDAINKLSTSSPIILHIVGITKEEFIKMYLWDKEIPETVIFWGRVSHREAIRVVKDSTCSIILRDNNSVVKAGFPTKLVESISCGTPVIINKFSNICDYLCDDNSIVIENYSDIQKAIKIATEKEFDVDHTIFDYRNFCCQFRALFGDLYDGQETSYEKSSIK